MIYSPWFAELALEIIGASLYFRKSKLLSGLFAFLAASDIALLVIYQVGRQTVYGWAYWAQRLGKYQLLIWLACSICGIFVQERRKSFTRISAAFLSLGSAAIITAFSASGETLKDRLLDAEIAANMILLGMVFLGWISRRAMLDQTWKWIVAGFMLMVGSDLLFTGLWTFWDDARHWYPLGAIAAQAVWIAGPLKNTRLHECRADLGKRFAEVKKVSVC